MTQRGIDYGADFLRKARGTYPHQRSMDYSGPTLREFMVGPVVAARHRFAYEWDRLVVYQGIAAVRECLIGPSGAFTPTSFIGILLDTNRIEIADFSHDPDYWEMIAADPQD